MVVAQAIGCKALQKSAEGEEDVMRRTKVGKYLFLPGFLCLLFVVPSFIRAAVSAQRTPASLIESGTQRVLQILHESQQEQVRSLRRRKDEIISIISEYFSFDEMAKRSLGHLWKLQTDDKREEFTRLFRQLLFNTYISRLENYTGSSEQIYYDFEKIDGDYAIVETHIVYQGGSKVSIEYRLHRDAEQWKVYDVVVEGISFIDNYRSQFDSILANESFDSLLRRLHQKVDELN